MTTPLQDSLKAIVAQTDVLLPKVEAGAATPEEIKTFKDLTAQAKSIAEQIDAAKAARDVKDWSKQSDGAAVVPPPLTASP